MRHTETGPIAVTTRPRGRIHLVDLMAYKHGIDQRRAAALDELAAQAQELGMGD